MRRREPAVAGMFYPGDPERIAAFVAPFAADSDALQRARVLVGPHAGYVYSGAICGDGYAQVRVPDTVIVMGPNHTGRGAPNAIYARGAFALPGGDIPVDEALAFVVRDKMGLVDDEAAHRKEHSIEVHLPFLRAKNPKVSIVPICLGHLSFQTCEKMGRGLADVLRTRPDVMVVVSTDMSHYIPADVASRLDHMALDQVCAVDPRRLFDTVVDNGISMCGFIPTTVALSAARALGCDRGRLVRYGNSGEVSGDYHRVVGYASAVIP